MDERESLKIANLEAFKEADESLFQVLISHKPTSELIFDDKGVPDILIDGKPLYDGKATEFARKQVEDFWENPDVYSMGPFAAGDLDRYGNQFLNKVSARCKADGIWFETKLPPPNCVFMVVFGVGVGKHIDALLESTNAYFVIFVEPDRDHLVHSLETYSWHALFEAMRTKGGSLFFAIEDQPVGIAALVQNLFRRISPAAIDGTPRFVHTKSDTAETVVKLLKQGAPQVLSGLGILYDETLMMMNTYLNLRSGGDTIFVRTEETDIETPVFIVGAGPSLDNDMAFLRKNAEKAIIVSHGTALRPLLVNGITPNFHLEMENDALYWTMADLAPDYDLSCICLVAPTSVDSHIKKFFDDVVYFFRPASSPYPLFCDSAGSGAWMNCATLVNASLAFAMDFGARGICFFGTDFGTKGDGLDHAKDTVIYNYDTVIPFGLTRDYHIPVTGNFGGKFYISPDFAAALKSVNDVILFYGAGRQFLNCSDGALIENANPAHAEHLSFNSTAKIKKADLEKIRGRFTNMTEDWFKLCWNEAAIKSAINALAHNLAGLFRNPTAFQRDGYLAEYTRALRNPLTTNLDGCNRGDRVFVDGAVAVMFRGSVDQMLMTIKCYLKLAADPAKLPRLQNIITEEFSAIVEAMREDALTAIENPTNVPPPETDPMCRARDPIAELSLTWGDVPRNAPCPCMSGKRYKHCHGKMALSR